MYQHLNHSFVVFFLFFFFFLFCFFLSSKGEKMVQIYIFDFTVSQYEINMIEVLL